MKRFCFTLLLMGLLCVSALAQLNQPITQSFTVFVTPAPPALLNTQSFSNTTGTGFSTVATGGAIAAGTYRCGVTYFTATNTETPLSTDTAATSTITTTGSTSTVTIQPPTTAQGGIGGNVVGWRPYCGVSGGATGAETLVSITASVCALSTSSTPSCALTAPAVLTLQSQFAAGSGGPASPGTAITPALAQQAVTAIFENSQYNVHSLYWTVSGTAPGTCTVQLYNGTLPSSLSAVGSAQTCTSTGSYSFTGTAAYFAINLSAFTAGGTNTSVVFTYVTTPTLSVTGTPSVVFCGATSGATANCGNTFGGYTAHIQGGAATLASNAQVITFGNGFTSTSTYTCVANDITTRANPVQAVPTSATTMTITNTTGATDVINWICIGY